MPIWRSGIVLAGLTALVIGGCGRSGGGSSGGGVLAAPTPTPTPTPVPVTLTALSVAPTQASLRTGEQLTLVATGTWSDGHQGTAAATWQTSSGTVASVDAQGKVTGTGDGTATITATAVANTAFSALSTITVWTPVVYGVDYTDKLVQYPASGGARTVIALVAAPGGVLPGSLSAGVWSYPGGLYAMEDAPRKLWKTELPGGVTSPVVTFGPGSRHLGVVTDSVGNVFTIDTGGIIKKFDPVSGAISAYATTNGVWAGLLVDAQDNLYCSLLLHFGGGGWIWKIDPVAPDPVDPALKLVTTLVMSPATTPTLSLGMDRKSDGTIYACIRSSTSTADIYICKDVNADGVIDTTTAGEQVICAPPFSAMSGGSVYGLVWKGDGLLVNERSTGIHLLKDLDGDGLFMTAGEDTLWSPDKVNNGLDSTCIRLGYP